MPAEEKLGLTVLSRNAEMKQQFSSFMGKLLDNQHAFKAWHQCSRPHTPEELAAARRLIVETVQRDSFPGERAALQAKREMTNSSPLLTLDPYISDGLLRVGGVSDILPWNQR